MIVAVSSSFCLFIWEFSHHVITGILLHELIYRHSARWGTKRKSDPIFTRVYLSSFVLVGSWPGFILLICQLEVFIIRKLEALPYCLSISCVIGIIMNSRAKGKVHMLELFIIYLFVFGNQLFYFLFNFCTNFISFYLLLFSVVIILPLFIKTHILDQVVVELQ
jgi:hypothetical protein